MRTRQSQCLVNSETVEVDFGAVDFSGKALTDKSGVSSLLLARRGPCSRKRRSEI
jgi:hypothetical protein